MIRSNPRTNIIIKLYHCMNMVDIEEEQQQKIKIIVVGDTSVGKTSVVRRISSKQLPKKVVPTIGVEFESTTLQIRNRNIQVNIWDTSGQEKHNAITSQHYRKANGAIIVYDVTKKASFLNCSKWLAQIVQKAPDDVSILLLGNKLDKCQFRTSQASLAEQFGDSTRQIQREQAIRYASQNGLMFGEVSAITGYNIENATRQFLEKIMSKIGFQELNQNALLSNVANKQSNTCCKC